MVRTVPDDGAERAQWMTRHRQDHGPQLSRAINDDLHLALASASVRTEAFVTIVVPETRLAKEAREAGGGLDGRARVVGCRRVDPALQPRCVELSVGRDQTPGKGCRDGGTSTDVD